MCLPRKDLGALSHFLYYQKHIFGLPSIFLLDCLFDLEELFLLDAIWLYVFQDLFYSMGLLFHSLNVLILT